MRKSQLSELAAKKNIERGGGFLVRWKDADPGIAEVEGEGGWVEGIALNPIFHFLNRQLSELAAVDD